MPKVNEEEQQTPGVIPPGTAIDERYRVVRSIGQGGNGLVHEVEHILTGRRLALKSLIDETGLARLEQEARASSLMKNPHTAKITDMGKSGPLGPYLVMELLEGQSLRDLLEEAGQLPLELTVNIALQVCECLAEAHGHGIIHRDLKPENIFLCASPWPDQYDVKVLDFGIVKIASAGPIPQSSLTRTGSTVGTPYYMSLEQLRNSSAVDARADVYSLGVLLYECLSGRKPFQAETIGDLVYALCSGPPTALGRLRPDLPAELCDVVMRTLSMNREDRPASMQELASTLLPHGNSAFGLWMRAQGNPSSLSVRPPPVQPGGSNMPSDVKEMASASLSPGSRLPSLGPGSRSPSFGPGSRSASLGPGAQQVLSKRSPTPSTTSAEFDAQDNLPEEVTANTVTAAVVLSALPARGGIVEEVTGAEVATVPRPRPPRPVLDSETSSGRDTPTEMYVKDAPAEEVAAPSDSGRDRDTPTTSFVEPIGGPRDRVIADTMQSPLSPAEGEIETGESVQGIPFDVAAPPLQGDGAAQPGEPDWAPHRTSSQPSLPTLTPRGPSASHSMLDASASLLAVKNPLLATIPIPRTDLVPNMPLKERPHWQVVLDKALVTTGNEIEDKVRKFRAAPKQTQMLIGGAGGLVALVLLILIVRWLFR